MAYRFTGFLSPGLDRIAGPAVLPADATVRAIQTPFSGIGLRLPSLTGQRLTMQEILKLADQAGIAGAKAWLFIEYVTWGRVDAVYAAGSVNGNAFGPFDDSNDDTVEMTYVDSMSRIGIREEDALKFQPFYRGFWGE